MGTILPAIGGVVLLLIGGIYWKVFKPKRDATKAAEESKKATAARIQRNAELRTYVELKILPKVPPEGIMLEELNRLMIAGAAQFGEPFDAILYRDARDFACSKDAGLLTNNAGLISLAWKGKEKVSQASKKAGT